MERSLELWESVRAAEIGNPPQDFRLMASQSGLRVGQGARLKGSRKYKLGEAALAELHSAWTPSSPGETYGKSPYRDRLQHGLLTPSGLAPVAPPKPKDTRFASLGEIVEGEIIPRLMLAHRPQVTEPGEAGAVDLRITREAIEAFAQLAMGGDLECLLDVADTLLSRGVTVDSIHWDLIDPAAQRLETLWQDDRCAFVDVTMGATLLQQIVHELSFRSASVERSTGNTAFFAALPQQHTHLSLAMAEETFRRSGWQTWAETGLAAPAIADIVSAHAFDIICLSVDPDIRLDQVSEITTSVRRASRNRAICVMLLGRVLPDVSDLNAIADVVASDGREVLMLAERAMGRADHC